MAVFVLDRSGKPLMPCSEKRARKLLAAGRYALSITPFNTGKNNFPVSSHPLHEVAAECSIQSVALRADVASRQCA